jgi:CBS domain-containing protein
MGFVRDFVIENSGAHKGLLDIKHGGLRPIVDLARWAMIAGGLPVVTSTVARLERRRGGGNAGGGRTAVLRDAFELIAAVRMRDLKEAFQEVGQVQRGLELDSWAGP